MASYNFSTLNDKEFEELCRDLLQKKLNIFLESFKKGKDRGIDLRYSYNGIDHEIIVQAKHYLNSGVTKLLYVLKNEELPKVKMLSPSRYILTTSLPLSFLDKEKIQNIFEGFIKNTEDILGQHDLNNLLNGHPEVEKTHPKLFLSSINILNDIINNHIKSRSSFKIKEIQKTVHLYVPNKKYDEAIQILNTEHFLIITGEPGIGKTSLADFITYQHLADGFKLVYIVADLTDAEKILDDEEKQIFYFDDFLGANYLKVKHNPNQDAALINFITRIKESKNKRLILTTRTTILNQAKSDFERFKAPELDIARHEISITDYEPFDKALILYNHLFHSNISAVYLESLIANKTYLEVIKHRNYSPRIVQYITDMIRIKNVLSSDYPAFILDKFENPQDIWRSPYESQISESAKFLLQTMFTLPSGTNEQLILEAFNERINYEITANGFKKEANLFSKTLQELLGGFIHRRMRETGTFLNFYNPSFSDFMSNYLKDNNDEIKRILNGAAFTLQFTNSFTLNKEKEGQFDNIFDDLFLGFQIQKSVEKVKVPKELLLETVLHRIDYIKSFYQEKSRELTICAFLLSTFNISDIEHVLIELYPFIDFNLIPVSQFEELLKFTDIFENKERDIYSLAIQDWDKIIVQLFKSVEYESDFIRIKHLFDDFRFDYGEFLLKYKDELQTIVDQFWKNSAIDDKISNADFSEIFKKEKMLEKLAELENEVQDINSELELDHSPAFKSIYDWEYDDTIALNNSRQDAEDYRASSIKSDYDFDKSENPWEKIENIFDSLVDIKKE